LPASRSRHHRAGARGARAASPLVRRRVSLPVRASLLAFFLELPKRTRVPPTTRPSRRTQPRRASTRPVALWSREKTGLGRTRGADRAKRAAGPEASEISHGGLPVKRPCTPRRMHERMSRRDDSGNTLLRTGTATGLRQNHRFNPCPERPVGVSKAVDSRACEARTVTCRCFPADRAPRLAEDLFRDYFCPTAATPLTAVSARRLHHPLWCCKSEAKGRVDERTRTADLVSLRVIGHALQGCAQACKCRISKRVFFPCLAACCTVLRSRWYQSGIKRSPVHRVEWSRKSVDYSSPVPLQIRSATGTFTAHSMRGYRWQRAVSNRPNSRPTPSAACPADMVMSIYCAGPFAAKLRPKTVVC
jgi:hypothetical protein